MFTYLPKFIIITMFNVTYSYMLQCKLQLNSPCTPYYSKGILLWYHNIILILLPTTFTTLF